MEGEVLSLVKNDTNTPRYRVDHPDGEVCVDGGQVLGVWQHNPDGSLRLDPAGASVAPKDISNSAVDVHARLTEELTRLFVGGQGLYVETCESVTGDWGVPGDWAVIFRRKKAHEILLALSQKDMTPAEALELILRLKP